MAKHTLTDDDYDRENVIGFGKLVMEQDADISVLNQKGLHAAPFQRGVLMPEEYILKYLHDWIRARLTAD